VVDANAEHVAILNTIGLEVNGVRTKLRAISPEELDASQADLVLLAVRSDATRRALEPVVASRANVVSLQNGLNEDVIADVIGSSRTIGCVVGFGATWLEPGRITLDAEGSLTIGRLGGGDDPELEEAYKILSRVFPTRIAQNIRGSLWGKMLVNSVTVMGALVGMRTGELLASEDRRDVIARIVAEGIAVAKAERVRLGWIFGVPASSWAEQSDKALMRFAKTFGAIKSVTWRDFEIGRPTEIGAVTGEIVRRGEASGTPTPLSAEAYRMLREIEAGGRSPDPANLEAVANAVDRR
jgi:2-dehydropantoate 2-reductase